MGFQLESVGCVVLEAGDSVLDVGSHVLGQETEFRLRIFYIQALAPKESLTNPERTESRDVSVLSFSAASSFSSSQLAEAFRGA